MTADDLGVATGSKPGMVVRLALWDLRESAVDVVELRDYLRAESVDARGRAFDEVDR